VDSAGGLCGCGRIRQNASFCLVVAGPVWVDGLILLGLAKAVEALISDITAHPIMRHAATLICFRASAWLFWDACRISMPTRCPSAV